MEETAASAVMLLATQYHHKRVDEYAREVIGVITMIKNLTAHPTPQAPPANRTPKLMGRVLQYLFAAVWAMLRFRAVSQTLNLKPKP
jgi:hypothetical protein